MVLQRAVPLSLEQCLIANLSTGHSLFFGSSVVVTRAFEDKWTMDQGDKTFFFDTFWDVWDHLPVGLKLK